MLPCHQLWLRDLGVAMPLAVTAWLLGVAMPLAVTAWLLGVAMPLAVIVWLLGISMPLAVNAWLFGCLLLFLPWGARIAQWYSSRLVIERSWVWVLAGVAGELASPGSTFCADPYYFGICSTVMSLQIAWKRSWSFLSKRCRWQVTAKHTCTLCMWLWIKWHCKLVHGCMVYT